MMAGITLSAGQSPSGPRPLDLRRDLRQVADLIEEAFGPELDAAGRAALRELRITARLGPMLNLFAPSGQGVNDILNGFVWIEGGMVVGNVTVQRMPQFQSRYIIANVAVKEPYRGRGIASELMRLTMNYIAEQGGVWAILQVREDNDTARGMYQRLGFAELLTEYRLRAPLPPAAPQIPTPSKGELRLLYDRDWRAVRYLLRRALSKEARWWHPTRAVGFRSSSSSRLQQRLGRWFGVGHRVRWGLFLGTELMGVLDVDVFRFNEHRIDLLLYPDLREDWSAPLLAHALRYLQQFPQRPVTATLFDYQLPALEALNAFGFQPFVTLVNMRKRICAHEDDSCMEREPAS